MILEAELGVHSFGKTASGEDVFLYKLKNKHGMSVEITNYGGIVVRLIVPDRTGKFGDVVLGFNTLEEYLKFNSPYFGALIGRYCNRIAHGRFTLNGTVYGLALNNDPDGIPCSLHGGNRGFNKVLWKGYVNEASIPKLNLSYLSKDGEEGYPGNLEAGVSYSLSDANEFRIEYSASTDKSTPVNLTNHSYFNLKGDGSGKVLDHLITINADNFTPVNKGLIPTGEIRPVDGTPFDFRCEHAIGERISEDNEQLKIAGGYDQNFVLNKKESGMPLLAVRVYEPSTGRLLEVFTTEPGVQFYSGNFLDGSLTGKRGKPYNHRSGFALETQHFPDSPNHPEFPSAILKPGETFNSVTVYKFSTR